LPDAYGLTLRTYGHFDLANAHMTTHVLIGNEEWSVSGLWEVCRKACGCGRLEPSARRHPDTSAGYARRGRTLAARHAFITSRLRSAELSQLHAATVSKFRSAADDIRRALRDRRNTKFF